MDSRDDPTLINNLMVRTRRWTLGLTLSAALLSAGCTLPDRTSNRSPETPSMSPDKAVAASGANAVAHPDGPLDLDRAQKYILQLVNRDRAHEGLGAVEWDETAARAGRHHAEDMARNGFTAHWGSDGSTPEMRYTEAGGSDMVLENVGCVADAKPRALDPKPQFSSAEIERVERAFISERPPHDGHRRNILTPQHTHLGVGLVKLQGEELVCMAQEFVDRYGDYRLMPTKQRAGQGLRVTGELREPASFGGIGLARAETPARRSAAELLGTGSYHVPTPTLTFFPPGYVTPRPVQVRGKTFQFELLGGELAQPGVYEVSIWAKLPTVREMVMVSLRTVRVGR